MSTPTFSLLHATYGRPQKAAAAMRMWRDRAANPSSVEYILCADTCDETRFDLVAATNDIRFGRPQAFVEHPGAGSARAWDFAAKFSTGDVLVQVSDDVEPPLAWDKLLIERMTCMDEAEERGPYIETDPAVVSVSDGYRRDALLCTAIINRARYKQQGHFLFPGYQSVFSDDEFSVRAYADAEAGKCKLIDARDITFLHQNPYHTGAEQDDTLRRQNSPEAYALGGKLFAERNGHLMKYRTWS